MFARDLYWDNLNWKIPVRCLSVEFSKWVGTVFVFMKVLFISMCMMLNFVCFFVRLSKLHELCSAGISQTLSVQVPKSLTVVWFVFCSMKCCDACITCLSVFFSIWEWEEGETGEKDSEISPVWKNIDTEFHGKQDRNRNVWTRKELKRISDRNQYACPLTMIQCTRGKEENLQPKLNYSTHMSSFKSISPCAT
jgi:hypothetical protein